MRKGLIGSQYGDGHDETAVGLGLLAAVLPESEGSYKRLRRTQAPVARAGEFEEAGTRDPADGQARRAWSISCTLHLRYHCSCWKRGIMRGE